MFQCQCSACSQQVVVLGSVVHSGHISATDCLGDGFTGDLEAVLVSDPVHLDRHIVAVFVLCYKRVGALHDDSKLLADLLDLAGHVRLDRVRGLEAVDEGAVLAHLVVHAHDAGILQRGVLGRLVARLLRTSRGQDCQPSKHQR